jgi:hypothetical protein
MRVDRLIWVGLIAVFVLHRADRRDQHLSERMAKKDFRWFLAFIAVVLAATCLR